MYSFHPARNIEAPRSRPGRTLPPSYRESRGAPFRRQSVTLQLPCQGKPNMQRAERPNQDAMRTYRGHGAETWEDPLGSLTTGRCWWCAVRLSRPPENKIKIGPEASRDAGTSTTPSERIISLSRSAAASLHSGFFVKKQARGIPKKKMRHQQ